MEGLLWTVIVGGVIGWLASIVMKTNAQMGLVANIVVGIIGSWLGARLFMVLGGQRLIGAGMLTIIVVQIAGAMLLIAILKALRVLR